MRKLLQATCEGLRVRPREMQAQDRKREPEDVREQPPKQPRAREPVPARAHAHLPVAGEHVVDVARRDGPRETAAVGAVEVELVVDRRAPQPLELQFPEEGRVFAARNRRKSRRPDGRAAKDVFPDERGLREPAV